MQVIECAHGSPRGAKNKTHRIDTMESPHTNTVASRSRRRSGGLLVLAVCFMWSLNPILAAQPAHGLREASGAVVFEHGWLPAARVADHPSQHAESKMHGGTRGQSGSHIVVALFDKASGARISHATVEVRITPLGGAPIAKALEPMSIEGLPSYGGYVPVVRPGIYRIRFEARGVGIAGVASAEFEHRIAGEGGGR